MSDPNFPILLLVEDDPAFQIVVETALFDEGFEVLTANNGTAAIAELDANGTPLKALVTDIRLGKGPNGWEVGKRARELVFTNAGPSIAGGLVHHSDRGSQYVSIRYSERLAEAGMAPSVGSVGDSYDNALAEASTVSTGPKCSTGAGLGETSKPWSSPPSNGLTGSITGASSSLSAITPKRLTSKRHWNNPAMVA